MTTGKSETSILLQSWHAGDKNSLDALIDRHLPEIQARVHKRLGPGLRKKIESCDIVQDAMVQFLRNGPRIITNEEHFCALITRIVENSIRDKHDWFSARRRQVARERPLPTDTILYLDSPRHTVDTPSQSAQRHEGEAWIRLGIELLDSKDRELIVLRDWDKRSFLYIGEKLDISEEAARKRYGRAVGRLEKKIWELRFKGSIRDESREGEK